MTDEERENKENSILIYTKTILKELMESLNIPLYIRIYELKVEDYGYQNRGFALYRHGHTKDYVIGIGKTQENKNPKILILLGHPLDVYKTKVLAALSLSKFDEKYQDRIYHEVFRISKEFIESWIG